MATKEQREAFKHGLKVKHSLEENTDIGSAWVENAEDPWTEERFTSFKYGYMLAENEHELSIGRPHKHDLMDLYREWEDRFDEKYVELGENAFRKKYN